VPSLLSTLTTASGDDADTLPFRAKSEYSPSPVDRHRGGEDMVLRVIGAGVGRTGTFSTKLALEQLGFGPCHHMEEVDETSSREIALWQAAVQGSADWSENYAGFTAAVDWPTAAFWRELAEAYPDAKMLLTVRPAEEWYRSFSETIDPFLTTADRAPPEQRPFLDMVAAVIRKTGFRIPSTREDAVRAFDRHVETVKATIPADRLLVFEVKQGWGPLCRHLGVLVPAAEFPKTNNKEDFWKSTQSVRT